MGIGRGVDGRAAVPVEPRGVVAVLLVPAVVCLGLLVAVAAVELGVGVVLAFVGIAYIATATVLGLLGHRYRDRLPLRRRPVAQLELTWLAAWLAGIFTFTLVSAASGPVVGGDIAPEIALFPAFWLMAIPFVVVYLVAAPVTFWATARSGRRATSTQPDTC